MVRFARCLNDLFFGKLMSVYEESNLSKVDILYSDMDRHVALHTVEQEFYAYLEDVFFKTDGACYAIFDENSRYYSAVRIEPYLDGVILAGLETAPEFRRMGYAKCLYTEVLNAMKKTVYVHVHKDNHASLLFHKNFCFSIIRDDAVYLDGSRSKDAYTMRRNLSDKEICTFVNDVRLEKID